MDAFADGVVTTPDSLSLADGAYTADVALAGGSGRASVQSPAELTVKDGKVTAKDRLEQQKLRLHEGERRKVRCCDRK